jgi:adenylate cyclase
LAEIERIGRLQRFLAPQLAQVIASSDENASLLASHHGLHGEPEPEEVMRVLHEYHATLGEIIFIMKGPWSGSPGTAY